MVMYDLIWTVLIYGFVGWCAEVAFAAICHGKFVNRGFLNGAICPIYGFGVLLITTVLDPIKDNIFLLFIGSVFFTSLLEFITGFVLEKLFHEKWWDYSDKPLNICGYICVSFSLLWGVAATLVVLLVHPFIMWCVSIMPLPVGIPLLILLVAIFITDIVLTLIGILKLPKRMKAMIEIEAALKKISDEVGNNVADTVLLAEEKGQEFVSKTDELKVAFDEKRAEFESTFSDKKALAEQLHEKYAELLKKSRMHKRLFEAFPNLQNGRYSELLEKLREYKRK